MDSDEEDFVFYGTPIEREEEMTSRKKKSVAEASGQLRSLPAWKQEVRDEEGRRRFHGAFTGGFSAGYYNTAGSKEGWTPQTFTSSRKKRAETKEQSIFNFLDDDEKAEMESQSLSTSLQFDTFGFTAAEIARKQAEKEQNKRSSVIPGPVPDEIVVPAVNSIGMKLLLKMGWRHGRSIKDSHANSLYDARREARKAFLAFSSDDAKSATEFEPNENEREGAFKQFAEDEIRASQSTPVFVLNPKQDLHGLGYDPFKHAPEFRERKRLRVSGNLGHGNTKASMKGNLFSSKSGKVAPGFGIGALEEIDFEDEDIYASSAFEPEETYVQEIEESSRSSRDNKQLLIKEAEGVLPGFKVASNSDFKLERFDPPVIPKDFESRHKFSASLEIENKLVTCPPPPEVPPPEDNNLRLMIDGFATLVARCGKLFEDLSREKNKTNPLFSFLLGGNGHDYYERKLWEEQKKHGDQSKQPADMKSMQNTKKMTAETRGKILGERPLERSSNDSSSAVASADAINLQFNLSDTFIKPESQNEFVEATKPFKDDRVKQERFERFLKEKYLGGLRTTDSSGSSNMSEADRARERLDFEAAVETIEKGKMGQSNDLSSDHQVTEILEANMKFTSGGLEQSSLPQVEEQILSKMYPRREEFQWRPSPILCKRFDIVDPYLGKPPPVPRSKSRIDSLIFNPDFVKTTKSEETFAATRDSLLFPKSEPQKTSEQDTSTGTGIEPNNTNVERPVDLYKAIFSDDSDNEKEDATNNKGSEPKTKNEVGSTTLNRLIAGDFLESLGKELGLEVPPEPPLVIKTDTAPSRKETITTSAGDFRIPSGNANASSSPKAKIEPLKDQQVSQISSSHSEFVQVAFDGKALDHDEPRSTVANVLVDNNHDIAEPQKIRSKDDTNRMSSRRRRSSSVSSDEERSSRHSRRYRNQNSSSEDERNYSHRARHWHKSSTPDTDSSEDSGYRDYTKRETGEKGSSRRKSSGRKRSKHHGSRHKDSSNRSSRHGSSREHREDREGSRKSRDGRKDSSSSKSDSRRKHR